MTTEAASVKVMEAPQAPSAPVVLERHESFEAVADIEPNWDALVEAAGCDVYATFAWCRTWWEFYGDERQLALFLFRREGQLVGIYPLFFETVTLAGCAVRFSRLVGCDHSVTTCSPVVKPGLEREVVALLAKELEQESCPWDVLQLGPLAGYAGCVDTLVCAVREHFSECQVEVQPNGCHTVFDVPATYGDYLQTLSKNERRKLRREEKVLQRQHAVSHCFHTDANALMTAFNRFVRMHEMVWRTQGKLGHFGDWPRATEFHRTLISALSVHGRVYLSELRGDGEVLASGYRFRFGKMVHWFLSARAIAPEWGTIGLGRLLFAAEMKHDIELGASLVDGLGGYYDYKVKLGARLTEKRTIIAARREPWSRLRVCLFRKAAWVVNKGYYRLWFARLGPMLGVLRGPLWRSWIRSQG
jgi:CelD/BcsL family acetyltransferase involved in cellulose biosynthesis